MFPGTSPEAASALSRVVDPHAIPLLEPILPYSVVVRNGTSERLIGVTLRLRLRNALGNTVTHDTLLVSHPRIGPSTAALMTPHSGLSAVLRAGTSMRIPRGGELSKQLAARAYLYSQQTEVVVTLDAVIFEDGSIVGPDESRTLENQNATTMAKNAVRDELFKRRGSDIRSYLERIAASAIAPCSTLTQRDWYQEGVRDFAASILRATEGEQSPESVYSYLEARARASIPILRRRVGD